VSLDCLGLLLIVGTFQVRICGYLIEIHGT
jgi:hypothetical protein